MRLDTLAAALENQGTSLSERLRARFSFLRERGDAPKGVYLWGGVGRGKTLIMDYFYESLVHVPCERTHFYRFMRDVHAALKGIKEKSDPLDLVAERLAGRIRLLCLDEFFVSDIADAMILAGLFAGLFRRGVTLVTTSNVPPEELYKDGLQRARFLPAIELIELNVDVLHLDAGVDYRLRQLEQAPTYLDASDPDSARKLRERFRAMSGDAATRAVLKIEGRPIKAEAVGAGMVWFEFAEICEGPRSQNDYIEIAHLYHTVFVSHVPKFTALNENAARRFIMLIDEFYDRKVNLVVSAAAPPTELYGGEKLKFEFERAASRLIEMQTAAYLSGEHRP